LILVRRRLVSIVGLRKLSKLLEGFSDV
jgi:hypothetical protein